MFPVSNLDLHREKFPIVNILLISASILVFLFELTLGDAVVDVNGFEVQVDDYELTRFFNNYGVVSYELTGRGDLSEKIQQFNNDEDDSVLGVEGVSRYEVLTLGGRSVGVVDVYEGGPPSVWLTLFTSMFMHGGWLHLLSNMLFLWVFGDNVEDRLGRIKYLIFYVICGLFASAAQMAIDLDTGIPTIGASGAIAGVLGAYFLLFPTSRIRTVIFFIFITVVAIPAYLLIGIWIILQFFNAFISLGAQFAGGVAYWAHVGGFVAGFIIVAIFLGLNEVHYRIKHMLSS